MKNAKNDKIWKNRKEMLKIIQSASLALQKASGGSDAATDKLLHQIFSDNIFNLYPKRNHAFLSDKHVQGKHLFGNDLVQTRGLRHLYDMDSFYHRDPDCSSAYMAPGHGQEQASQSRILAPGFMGVIWERAMLTIDEVNADFSGRGAYLSYSNGHVDRTPAGDTLNTEDHCNRAVSSPCLHIPCDLHLQYSVGNVLGFKKDRKKRRHKVRPWIIFPSIDGYTGIQDHLTGQGKITGQISLPEPAYAQ